MYGWAGIILDVDLSSGRIEKKPFEEELGVKYIGGRGINSRILYNELKPGINPFSPENIIIFGTGPLAGTIAPSPSKLNVTAKAHYNYLGTSNAGGRFASELKWAGYDHIIMRGKAPEPVYLWIDDDVIELKSAKHLWGKDTWETERIIKEELGDRDVKIASIGPAGENLVTFSSITFSLYRSAAQTGMGAIMGSKNLKGIAVRGTKSIEVAKPTSLKRLTKDIIDRMMKNHTYSFMSVHGTPAFTYSYNERGNLSIRNFRKSGHWDKVEAFSLENIFKYYTADRACFGCPIHCSHFFVLKEGEFAGERGGGIEFGHLLPLGISLDNSNLLSVFKATNLCNQYGMDTLEFSFVLGAAIEWYGKGIITDKDTDGIPLEWGDYRVIIDMIPKIAKREGLGDILAQGAIKAAKILGKGAEECISHCKGMAVAADDVRLSKGTALSHVTGTIPAHHEEGMPTPELYPMDAERAKELFGTTEVINPLSYDKALCVIYYQNQCTLFDCIELCKFISEWFGQEVIFKDVAELFSSATGIDIDAKDMEMVGERVHTLERAFNVREGMRREDDHMHGRIVKEATQSGPFKGERLEPEKFEEMLDKYYDLRGWDKKTGIPLRSKFKKVGLEDIAEDLEKIGIPLED
jgi:aldehyde:ferredoxin oxidoreductase